ncbi:hypothetical protein MMC07_000836 [Pseudocyphellaria aurata]|nr:hypothetical protein [Pseudocyphellaria aurata]
MSSNVQSALRFSEKGPFNTVLKVASIPIPEPPSSHSLIQVRASAINLSDVGNVEGRFEATTLPRTPGRDFAGTVVRGPPETIGKNVWGTGGTNSVDRDGSHAEYLVIPSDCVEEMPSNLSFAQAAACGVAFLTAAAMVDKAKPTKGDFVLVLGSSGAVGSAAMQLLKQIGATPLETSRRGDSQALNIAEDLKPQIEAKTEGKGVAAVIDTVGESTLFKKALEALEDYGRYVIITAGRTPGFQFTFNALEFYRHNKSLHGINTLGISLRDAVALLAGLKSAFETGELQAPSNIEEVDLAEEKAVLAAYEKVKGGTKAKQVLVNKNL